MNTKHYSDMLGVDDNIDHLIGILSKRKAEIIVQMANTQNELHRQSLFNSIPLIDTTAYVLSNYAGVRTIPDAREKAKALLGITFKL